MRCELILLLYFCSFISVESSRESESDEYEEEYEEPQLNGGPINVLNVTEKNEFIANINDINQIFNNPKLTDRQVVAVSIVGIFRKGKSFLLNYFLRYLYRNFKSVNQPDNPLNSTEDWIGNKKEPLIGFQWKPSTERVTNGIIMWSDVFIYDTPEGDNLAIVLIDTQGLFDQKTSPSVNSKMFALSTLISSVQIYNLHNVIQEDQLQYLQFTSDFAKLINNVKLDNDTELEKSDIEKPFQNIILLIRDWANNAAYKFGLKGGEEYLNSVLENSDSADDVSEDHNKDAREVRKFIRLSYEKVNCFLMPHPGSKIFNNAHFEGEWSKLNVIFVQQLKDLISWIFNPSNLSPKKIFNKSVTVENYAEHLKFYFEAAASSDIMNVSTIFDTTMEIEGNLCLQKSLKEFRKNLRNNEKFENQNFPKQLNKIGKSCQEVAIKHLHKLMENFDGNENFMNKWTEKLKNQMSNEFNNWKIEVMVNYNKFLKIKEQSQQETAKQIELMNKDFETKIHEIRQNTLNEKAKLRESFEAAKKSLELERSKIQQELELEQQKITQGNTNSFEISRNECQNILLNNSKNQKAEMNELKEREKQLQAQILKLVNNQKIQENKIKQLLEEDVKIYKTEIMNLEAKIARMEKDMKWQAEDFASKLKYEQNAAELYKKSIKLRNEIKDLEHKAELERAKNNCDGNKVVNKAVSFWQSFF